MKIRDYYFNEDNRVLYVEFSTKEDGDDFYRMLEFDCHDIEYYSTEIIDSIDSDVITESFIVDLINNYLNENELPEEYVL